MIKGSEKKRTLPLMFIQQPDFDPPKIKMQNYFVYRERPEPIHIHEEKVQEDKASRKEKRKKEAQEIKKNNEAELEEVSKDVEKKSWVEIPDKSIVSEKQVEVPKEVEEVKVVETNEIVEQKNEEEKPQAKKRISFNELILEDKLKFLKTFSQTNAKIIFEFTTEEGTFSGYLLSQKYGEIEIHQIWGRKKRSFPPGSILDVKMIGL
ncbi:MAG: CotO family spore coat protein [Bacillota bacterium]|nr:CotO family spore coat protein [Bacillota bacterium]